MTRWATGLVVLAVCGCSDRELGSVTPEVQHGFDVSLVQPGEVAVDLLVVVDDSHSMHDEQRNLAENFQHLVRSLTSPADEDHDGEPDHAAVTDLHVGIVSTDMGVRGAPGIDTCSDALDGDDGVLISSPRTAEFAGCADSYPAFLSYDPTSSAEDVFRTPEELDAAFGCLAMLGTRGCGYEQQLDAMVRALDFHDEGANAGFLREDSLLAVVMLTDEEDCSVRRDLPDAVELFADAALGNPNLRCFRHGGQYLTPVREFVDRLMALRADRPDHLVFAGITGIPLETGCPLSDMGDADFSCVLADPRMQQVEAADGTGLVPACQIIGRGEADPARRIVEAIQGVDAAGGSGIVRSICEADYRPAMEAITSLIQSKVLGACLARPLQVVEDQVDCVIRETFADDRECGAGRIDRGVLNGRRECRLCQRGDGAGPADENGPDLSQCASSNESGDYWEYVPAASDCPATGKVSFLGMAVPLPGSAVRLECCLTE